MDIADEMLCGIALAAQDYADAVASREAAERERDELKMQCGDMKIWLQRAKVNRDALRKQILIMQDQSNRLYFNLPQMPPHDVRIWSEETENELLSYSNKALIDYANAAASHWKKIAKYEAECDAESLAMILRTRSERDHWKALAESAETRLAELDGRT
jgi:hypothetical protein